jgi:hypothetical protein
VLDYFAGSLLEKGYRKNEDEKASETHFSIFHLILLVSLDKIL